MSKIFLSYRRDDAATACGRMYDRLVARFGKESVFKDVDSIPLGVNFRDYINGIMEQCAAQVVVIGRQWLNSADAQGNRRLDDSSDVVRLEIEAALRQGRIAVIPVLVQGANLPSAALLPSSLHELVARNGMSVRDDPDFDHDMRRLMSALALALALSASPGQARSIPPLGAVVTTAPEGVSPGSHQPAHVTFTAAPQSLPKLRRVPLVYIKVTVLLLSILSLGMYIYREAVLHTPSSTSTGQVLNAIELALSWSAGVLACVGLSLVTIRRRGVWIVGMVLGCLLLPIGGLIYGVFGPTTPSE